MMGAAENRAAALADEIAHLRGLDLDGLRERWRSLTGRAAPAHVPKTLLLRVLAYRVQAAALGDLDRVSARLLDRLASDGRSSERAGGSGTRQGRHQARNAVGSRLGGHAPARDGAGQRICLERHHL